MTVTTTYPTTATTKATATGGTATGAASVTTDFDMFLKMLTTQMQNQDPLNPIDSADYAMQLATFSGVEQQMQTNTLLTSLSAQMGLIGMSQLAGWVGQEARAQIPVAFDGATPVTLSPNPAQGADRAVLVVKDANGTLVSREDIPTGTESYQWLAADAAGDPLAAGTYTLTLESYSGDTLLATTGVDSYAEILEVRGGTTGTTLILAGGAEVSATAVTALRKP